MKRVLAAALAAALILLVPGVWELVAEACTDPSDGLGFSVCMDTGANVLDDSEISNFGARVLGTDTISITIPIRFQEFKYWDGTDHVKGIGLPEYITEDVMNRITLHYTDDDTAAIFREPHKLHWTGDHEAMILLVAERIGVAVGDVYITYRHSDIDPATGTYRLTESKHYPIVGRVIDPTINKKITGLTDKSLTDEGVQFNGAAIAPDKIMELDAIPPESILAFALNTEYFVWDPLIDAMETSVRKSTLDNNQVGVQIKVAAGSRLIESAKIENISGEAFVVVRFAEFMPYVTEKDFDFTIYLTYQGARHLPSETQIRGSMTNSILYVDGEEDYAFIGDGTIVEALSFTPGIELDLGGGVSIYRNLIQDKKYYGTAHDERTGIDREIMEAYPSIRRVVNLTGVNLSAPGNVVKLSYEDDQDQIADENPKPVKQMYYVYDEDGKLLGTTGELIPYREKYYFSTGIITLDVTTIDLPDDDFDDDVYDAGNYNDNPDTGRTTGMDLSGIILLATGVAVGRKRILRTRRAK